MIGFLLDTNVLSDLARAGADESVARWADRQPAASLFISEVSVGEIEKGINKLPRSRCRQQIEGWLQQLLAVDFAGRVIAVDRAIWVTWGRLSGEALRRGRSLPALDALVAATAIEHDLVLATRDTSVLRTTGVRLIDPWRT